MKGVIFKKKSVDDLAGFFSIRLCTSACKSLELEVYPNPVDNPILLWSEQR